MNQTEEVSHHRLRFRRIRIAFIAVLGLGILFAYKISGNMEEYTNEASHGIPATPSTKIEYGVKYSMRILGTYDLDVDTISLGGRGSQLRHGALRSDVDLFWSHTDKRRRQLRPARDATVCVLRKQFEEVNLEDMISATYSRDSIDGSDNGNQLKEGTVIGIRTNKGNYAKMRVDGYVPLRYRHGFLRGLKNMLLGNRSDDIRNYDLEFTLLLYKPESNKQ